MRQAGVDVSPAIFEEQGLAFPLRVLSTEEAAAFRSRCDELEAALGGKPRTIEVRQMHLHFCWAYELATHPAILDAVQNFLGPDLAVWATELFAKHPQDANVRIGWHRDSVYMGFSRRDVLTAWIALSDSHVENGCMQAVPGPDRFAAQTSDSIGATHLIPEESIDPARVVNVELDAGEMSIHDNLIPHGSRPNLSDRKRVGFAIRYVRGDARHLHGRPPVLVARGKPSHSHFEFMEPPSQGDGDLSAFKRSAVRHFDSMLINLQKSSG